MADMIDVSPQPTYPREYLGDGLYVEFDGYRLRLWCDRGDQIHEVYLETGVLAAFFRYVEKLKGGSVAKG